ncbi:TPA: LysR family transcriptional regulator, partial [Burkholderia vietnamiensis]|nr:LysR family transcriptional regulator [Burkholderia vietnamiensis]
MNDQQRDLNDLYYFVQVVEHGGFAPAGRALNMPKSKLSRRVALLEARLGMRLIQRSTRRFTVTDVGQTYYAHCRAMLVEADAADEAIALLHEEPRGIVRVSCPVALLDSLAGAMIAAFMVACPHVEIHLEATNRRVDVVGEGIDVAIRVRPPPLEDSDLALRVLAERGQCLVASPALLREHGAPAVPADLTRMP